METVQQTSLLKSKTLIKGVIIGILALLLMIPEVFISELVHEREYRQKEAIAEVGSKWGGRQDVAGPIVVLPFWQTEKDTLHTRIKHFAYFLPDELNINASVSPQEKHRGIYKVMLYNTRLHLSGSFKNIPLDKLQLPPGDILWNEAYLQFNLTDVKGLNDELNINWNNKILQLATDNRVPDGSLAASLPVLNVNDFNNIHFAADLNFNGSEQLLFTPVGKTTAIVVNSSWPHPSFNGNILPQSSKINNNGFTATWKSLSHKRTFPQQWKDNPDMLKSVPETIFQPRDDYSSATIVNQQSFGVDLFIPVNNYQKTLRSVKYSTICILLTFAAFFLIETTSNRPVHPFQYGLIGLAILLFYTLLLSFSEYIGFNLSYVIASICTIGLIAWFSHGILGSKRLALILAAILVLMYTYLFTILQLQDYSLLLGSIGLFITLAVVMQFSKKIKW
jgi:inner membrane protein